MELSVKKKIGTGNFSKNLKYKQILERSVKALQ
jgi:hypothetical protein